MKNVVENNLQTQKRDPIDDKERSTLFYLVLFLTSLDDAHIFLQMYSIYKTIYYICNPGK